MSAVAAQFKGFILYNNRQTDGANGAHPPDVESDTLQCLCCLSAACSYTIHTLTSRQHTHTYTHRHETVELIGNLYSITESLVLHRSSFSVSISVFFTRSFAPTDHLTIYQTNIQGLASVYPLNGFLHLRHQFCSFHKTETCESLLTLQNCVRH